MKTIKNLFSTPLRAVISTTCAVALVAAVGITTAFATSAAAQKNSIEKSVAQNIAYTDAGIDAADVTKSKVSFDHELGSYVYEVDFTADGMEYDYLIDAKSGKVVSKTSEKDDNFVAPIATTAATTTAAPATTVQSEQPTNAAQASGLISLETAKNKALQNANVKATDAKFIQAYLDTDDGVKVYDIEFITSSYEYDYEINATTGAVIEKSVEKLTANVKTTVKNDTTKAPTTTAANSTSKVIDLASAKSKALADSKVKASDATFVHAYLDTDDGVKVYDIEFRTATAEYDYEINAATGKIIDKDVEYFKIATTTSASTTYIGVEKAKSIALEHAGLSASSVRFSKAMPDYDDGVKVYEIEFFKGVVEYEYSINAKTGKIIEWDKEISD